ncbi:MAG TPA: hypothetical protein VNG69_10055 [Casimicrobiaceae bacterium]|nr:hypothetical protein [Casimicrobiaceae bacterium]
MRTDLSWPWRVIIAAAFAGIVGGMWWWGYDFGQWFAGFQRGETEAQVATLVADLAIAQREVAELRAQNTRLQSDVAMMRGTQSALARHQAELLTENAAMKDELSLLRSFVADGTKTTGATGHRPGAAPSSRERLSLAPAVR